MKIWYHGTNRVNAHNILHKGFRSGTWFAAHLEDALAFGGNYIFEVALTIDENVGWQICMNELIPHNRIVALHVFQKECLLDRPDLRHEIFEPNSDGSVSGLEGKMEYHKWTTDPNQLEPFPLPTTNKGGY